MTDDFRRIPGYPNYFINKTGELKRMYNRGRKPLVRRDITGERVVTLWDRREKLGLFKIKDLIRLTWPENRT